jgi:guanosine-3',5'-bis(diphosphate) 3'-pyrophosphohydrolase
MNMKIQTLYQTAIKFAASKHGQKNQLVPGTNLPYLLHLSNVAMEIMIAHQETRDWDFGLAVQLALLHDTLEDTATAFEELETIFGAQVAEGVAALTKNPSLPKENQMIDSLTRIKKLGKEVWSVKLADRITNLQPPPHFWKPEKINRYREEASLILSALEGANEYLEKRLSEKILSYGK